MERIQIWRIATFVLVGIVMGLTSLLIWPLSSNQTSDPKLSQTSPQAVGLPGDAVESDVDPNGLSAQDAPGVNRLASQANVDFLRQGDHLLRAGNSALALDSYLRFEKDLRSVPPAFLLRKAICHELNESQVAAEDCYRSALTSAPNPNHRLLAIAGMARTLTAQSRHHEAVGLLAERELEINRHPGVPAGTREQLQYQWAKVLEATVLFPKRPLSIPKRSRQRPKLGKPEKLQLTQAGNRTTPGETPRASPMQLPGTNSRGLLANEPTPTGKDQVEPPIARDDLLSPMAIAIHQDPVRPEVLLNLIDSAVDSVQLEKTQSDSDFQVLQRPAVDAATIIVSVIGPLHPVAHWLARIEQESGLTVQISDQARDKILGRSRSLAIESITLSSLMDQLLLAFDLVWYQEDSQLHVVARSDLPDWKTIATFESAVATRAFRQFEIDFPESSTRKEALFARGGLAFREQRFDDAANIYQELEQVHPTGEVQAKLFFNLAKLNLLFDRQQESTSLLYKALDQSDDELVSSSAYCLLGTLHLSDGDLQNSIRCSRRGLAIAKTESAKRYAILNLTRAFLLNRDPFGANEAIFNHREVFAQRSPQRAVISIHGAFARTLGLSDRSGLKVARERLLSAISMFDVSTFESFADCYIAALVYRELGFENRAVEMLLLSLAKPNVGQWRRRIIFELASSQESLIRLEDAAKTYESLVDTNDVWRLHALERLIEISSKLNRQEACIEYCRSLWQLELTKDQKAFVLQRLGHSFQQRGEHHAAALCFAGMMPSNLNSN